MVYHKFITKNRSFQGRLILGFIWVGVAIVLTERLHMGDLLISWLPIVLAIIWVIGGSYWGHRKVKQRNKAMERYVAAHQVDWTPDGPSWNSFVRNLGSIDDMHKARDQKITNVLQGPDWMYGDFSYNLYGKTKYGEYIKATVYYGVMSTTLSRDLPNVFFDSKKARNRQFRFEFSKSQLHSLEGDFDTFFATYFPTDYTIDSMSFISPEVMWAMRGAANYDIEIYNNRLLLYGPLFDPVQQIPDMSTKLLEIKRQLSDNIDTYRDERLPYAEGRQKVAPLGARLTTSSFWKIVGAIIAIGYILAWVWLHTPYGR